MSTTLMSLMVLAKDKSDSNKERARDGCMRRCTSATVSCLDCKSLSHAVPAWGVASAASFRANAEWHNQACQDAAQFSARNEGRG